MSEGLISDIIVKLEEKASVDTSHKTCCDKGTERSERASPPA